MPCLKSSWRAVTSRPPVGCWARIYKSFCRPSRWDRGEEITNNWRGCKYVFFSSSYLNIFSYSPKGLVWLAPVPPRRLESTTHFQGISRRVRSIFLFFIFFVKYVQKSKLPIKSWMKVFCCWHVSMIIILPIIIIICCIIRPAGTPWTRLAVLFNLLSRLKTRVVEVTTQPQEGILKILKRFIL